jgi:YHS domain-containing protein
MKMIPRIQDASRAMTLAVLLTSWFPVRLLAAGSDQSASQPGPAQIYNLGADRVALKGFDPVSYFTQSTAVKGKKEIKVLHEGITYCFATEEDRKLFTTSPRKYLPAYGGWCATAMAKGEKVEVDPNNFKVTNGRLFLFYKGLFGNALNDWTKDEAGLTAKADAHWKTIANE